MGVGVLRVMLWRVKKTEGYLFEGPVHGCCPVNGAALCTQYAFKP